MITGTVTDPDGAVVPGANVSVINQATNVATSVVTDATGSFTFPYLAPGLYAVNVERPGSGFAKYSRTDVVVSTAQTVKVEVRLQAGITTETVMVKADAASLQTSSATVQRRNQSAGSRVTTKHHTQSVLLCRAASGCGPARVVQQHAEYDLFRNWD